MLMLDESQISEFREKGVVVVQSALSAEDLQPLRRQHQQWIEQSRHHAGPFGEMLDGRPRFDVEPGHSAEQPALRRIASPEEISDDFLGLLTKGPLLEQVTRQWHHGEMAPGLYLRSAQ
jgi:phytanoyl-CoA hydroxylase